MAYEQTKDDLKTTASDLKSGVKTAVREVTDDLSDRASEWGARAKNLAEDAREKAREELGAAAELVRRYPVQSLLVGFGLGFVIGKTIKSGKTPRLLH